ncbi:hypothetical protein FRB90_004001 [Tulasnella sp. 427]|nr:hypothetical protein FRB90_004001 [Tulasnella sp. 427]
MALQFWKPGTVAPGSSLDRATEAEGHVLQSAPLAAAGGIQAQRERLPIFKHRESRISVVITPTGTTIDLGEKLLYCVEKYGVTIVVGQTGCGKTTQVPQYLYESGWAAQGHVIACTQPRRVAATSVATRVAQEVGTLLGDEVGYTIRFEDVSDKERTRIKYMTDGMLFRETMLDPLLSKYSVIMIDEAHERSIYTDLLLGILKKIRRKRPTLRLIVSSATLDATSFHEYFTTGEGCTAEDAVIVSLEGRMFPVEIAYLKDPCSDYVMEAVRVVWEIHLRQGPGDILVFLTGREEIDRCISEIAERIPTLPKGSLGLQPLPLYAGLTTDAQLAVFRPAEKMSRKVVVSTNIAEASVTIDGIKFVVDCGFVKIRTFNAKTTLSRLTVVPTSRASAIQRAGRAGRTSPGVCFRLYTESAFHDAMPATTPPEIVRTDLTVPILQLKALGIDDLVKFEWVTNPPAEGVLRALEALVGAGMVGPEDGRLTLVGEKVAEWPVEVNIARALFSSKEYKCSEEMLTIAAMVSVQDAFVIPDGGGAGALAELERRKFTAEEGDHLTLLNAYNAFIRYGSSSSWCRQHALNFRALSRAVSIRSQLKKYMQRFGLTPLQSCEGDAKRLRKCLVSGFWKNAASIRIITEIEPDWLLEYGHKYVDRRTGQ